MSEINDEVCDHSAETRIVAPTPAGAPREDSAQAATHIGPRTAGGTPVRPPEGSVAGAGGSASTQVRYFGTYELIGEIARGGMGVVYKARQNTLNRTVAVKVILSGQLATGDEVRRFLVEAEAAANLSHPGIVPVYEFGEHDGTHYFSMAYIDGPSLAEKLGEGALDAAGAVDLMIPIAEAVEYAHGQGVIHRDLKPGNILLEKGAIPRIADFGLAKRMNDDAELTQSGTILGSIYYMPPEQAAGRSESIGPASDVYALGAILYRMLTGRPPFQAATGFETMQQVLTEEPVAPRQLNSMIPRDLETICLKCLEKEPTRRYASARALGEELARFRDGLPILARPISRTARVWRWYRRNPVPATLGAVLIAVVVAGLVIASILWSQARAEQRRAEDQAYMVGVLSELVLKKALDETDGWLRGFFEPIEQQLLVARAWGAAGLLDKEEPDHLNALLVPLIATHPQLSSLMVADSRGREHMLLCIEQPTDDGSIAREWKNRITRRDEWGDTVRWLRWSDRDPVPAETTESLPDYDPRVRPWYQGATRRPATAETVPAPGEGAGRIHWTSPYVFFTTKDLGITASTTFDGGDGLEHVFALDVLLEDITKFTTSRRPTENGQVAVLTEAWAFIGLPGAERLEASADWKPAFLKQPEELGLDTIAAAQQAFKAAGAGGGVLQFSHGARNWWAGLRPFTLGASEGLWILVIVPESDLREDLARRPAP